MSLPVYLLQPPDEKTLAHLRARLVPGVQLILGPDLPVPANYHVLVAGRPQCEHLNASPDLRVLIIPWAGLPDTTRALLMGEFAHVAVHNLHHNAAPVAEMVLALLLAAAKHIVPADRALRAHDWTPRYRQPNPSLLLQGKTALILGYGAIGQRVARMCRGLGMRVLGVRRNVTAPLLDVPDEIHSPEALRHLLPQANALLICLPLTPATTGLIGAHELALLPPGAVLVNVGRGPIVDQTALYQALHDGTLYAAGLDVWYNYPPDEASRAHTPPSAYPFHELDNVVLSPHRAGGSTETNMQRMTHLARLLNAAARGDLIPNRVDLGAGY
jgi:phosphoglycerate dehydrogenase-like enzyme